MIYGIPYAWHGNARAHAVNERRVSRARRVASRPMRIINPPISLRFFRNPRKNLCCPLRINPYTRDYIIMFCARRSRASARAALDGKIDSRLLPFSTCACCNLFIWFFVDDVTRAEWRSDCAWFVPRFYNCDNNALNVFPVCFYNRTSSSAKSVVYKNRITFRDGLFRSCVTRLIFKCNLNFIMWCITFMIYFDAGCMIDYNACLAMITLIDIIFYDKIIASLSHLTRLFNSARFCAINYYRVIWKITFVTLMLHSASMLVCKATWYG